MLGSIQNIGLGNTVQRLPSHATAGSFKMNFDLPALPYQVGNTNNGVARGFQLSDVTMVYAISSGSATSSNNASTMTFAAYVNPSSGFTHGSSISSDATAYGGTFTFGWDSSEGLSSMASSASSNLNVVVCTPSTTVGFINTDNQRLTFEWAWNTGSTNFGMNIWGAIIHGTWLFGG